MKKLALFLLCALLANVSSKAANIIWISFHSADNTPSAAAATAGFTQAPDVGYTQLLANNGHTVTRVVTLDNAGLNAAMLNAADLVIISRSVPSGHYQTDAETAFWHGITAPTLILGGYVIRGGASGGVRLGFMAGDTIPDTATSVRLRARYPNHPIFAGLSLDSGGTMVNPYANIVSFTNVAQRGISVVTGATAGNGTVLATVAPGDPTAGGMVIGEWLAGATMNTTPNGGSADTLAGHRLILLTGSREVAGLTAEGAGIYDLTPDGAQLLLNAVNYMTSGRIALQQVNTTNEVAGAGEMNLAGAIAALEDGDTIVFSIPGAGPHYLRTPTNGYPLITKNNVMIDGYSQPGAMPNTNPILASNNAQLRIVLDSRDVITPDYTNYTNMGYEPDNSTAGFSPEEFAVLGILGGTNVHIRGLCLLGSHGAGLSQYGIAIARTFDVTAEAAHISGCWIGVDVDRTSAYGFDSSIAAFRHRGPTSPDRPGSNRHTIGVKPGSADPRAEFNVIVGGTINIIMEGQGFRISGNFLGVLPSGTNDFIPPFAYPGAQIAESHLEIGRGASDLVIGTDGDGVNDADERNIMGGVVTSGHSSQAGALNLGGYRHVVELYSLSSSPGDDRTRNRFAGNYIGVGVDGVTRFTNGVSAFNGSATAGSVYWVGSDFDGVSDAVEANVINNNYPGMLFYSTASGYTNAPTLGFFDEPNNGALYSARGNKLVNNYPFPVNPGRDSGSFILNYVNKALETPRAMYSELLPVLSASSSTARLVGTVPKANATYAWTIIDLYLPDPEGLVNGLEEPDANLPNGWVQGSNYLASFVLDSSADRDPSPEGFAFDICSLGLAVGTMVTVSANYSQDPPGTHNARVLTSLFSTPMALANGIAITSITSAGSSVTINWCGGSPPYQLQKKTNLADPMWTNVGAATSGSTATDTASGGTGFYQVVGN
jgi:hypothetical protein